jgi:hypothetical protein
VNQQFDKLISIASEPIGSRLEPGHMLDSWGSQGNELAELLRSKNGFYAYESALLVRAMDSDSAPVGLLEWNAPTLWKSAYEENLSDTLFFAEDAFGGQYCIRAQAIYSFDPETGLFEAVSDSLRGWVEEVLRDYPFRTGYPLAHAWQMTNGPLAVGTRLIPKTPFVCGGQYDVGNLYVATDLDGMIFRASIANQIRDLPDGTEIVIKQPGDSSML